MTTTTRQGYSCQRCAEWFYCADTLPVVHVDYLGAVADAPCPICGGQLLHRGRVHRDNRVLRDYEDTPCNDQCTSARGVVCDCRCHGTNHGSSRTVTRTVVEGSARLDLADVDRLARMAAKRLPEIEAAEALQAVVIAEIDELFAHAIAARRTGAWLPRTVWQQSETVYALHAQIRRASNLKTPRGRIRALEAVRQTARAEAAATGAAPRQAS